MKRAGCSVVCVVETVCTPSLPMQNDANSDVQTVCVTERHIYLQMLNEKNIFVEKSTEYKWKTTDSETHTAYRRRGRRGTITAAARISLPSAPKTANIISVQSFTIKTTRQKWNIQKWDKTRI